MSEYIENKEKSEIERLVDLDRMGRSGAALDIVASETEGAALAKRFGFLGLSGFGAHSNDAEYVQLNSIVPRLYLTTRMIMDLSDGKVK